MLAFLSYFFPSLAPRITETAIIARRRRRYIDYDMTQITTPTTEPFAIPPGLEKAWKQLERKNNTFLSTTSSGGALVQSDAIETVAEYWVSTLFPCRCSVSDCFQASVPDERLLVSRPVRVLHCEAREHREQG